MYLSAERLAIANQGVKEAFEQCSIAWQAIPHWDTRDPGQINVANGLLGTSAGFLPLDPPPSPPPPPTIQLTVAEAIAPTSDALLTAVMAATEILANNFDTDVLNACYKAPKAPNLVSIPAGAGTDPQKLQNALINSRVLVENAGYRAPSCLVTNTQGLLYLNQLANGYYNILQQTLAAANINSLYRFDIDGPGLTKARMVLIGRRRRIAQGAAPEASPGEEPVDLAFSVLPSAEVDGETGAGAIQLSPRIRYATRITDATGLVALKE